MPSLSNTILGPVRRSPQRARAARPAPTSAPTPPRPAPERRAEQIEPGRPPAEGVEPEMVRVLLVDPSTRTISEAWLPIDPGDAEGGYGIQLGQDAVTAILGDAAEWAEVGAGLAAMVDTSGEPEPDMAWRLGENGEVLSGRAIIAGYDDTTDAWIDAEMSIEDAREAIKWGDGAGEAEADEGEEAAGRL